jgi:hypothetical protein
MGKNITDRMQANIFTNHPDSGAFLGASDPLFVRLVSSCIAVDIHATPGWTSVSC